MRVGEMREKIEERMNEERELVVSERFFEEMKREEIEIGEVEIKVKGGRRENELTKYRYDVIVRKGREEERAGGKEVEWEAEQMSVEKLSEMLREGREERIKVKGIINRRVERELRLVEEVKRARVEEKVEEIWERISEEEGRGEEVERMVQVGEEEGYRVEVRWGDGAKEMEVEYRRGERKWKNVEERREEEKKEGREDIRRYGNEPLKGIYRRELSKELREYVQERVPEIMVPSEIVVMDGLPKTATGKIDRKALPALDRSRPDLKEDYTEPRTDLEIYIAEMWQEILGIDKVGVHDNFFELGGDSIRGAIFINRLQERLGQQVYVVILFDAPNIADLTVYLNRHYSEAVARITGRSALIESPALSESIDDSKLRQIRGLIPPLAPFNAKPAAPKNPSAIFILSPPRSGSTLMRVMLAGHRQLFAPPELELLGFNTLGERKAAFSARYGFWLEGMIRAIMHIKGCDADRANTIMQECESQNMSVKQFYRLMQEWARGRTLVDKTPSYALDIGVLNRAEEYFDNAMYIHLLRHPHGMIRSFEEAKLEQVFFRYQHNFSNRELAELIWVVSQQNIVSFLEAIPQERKYKVRFEELVKQPSKVLEGICGFLGLEFQSEMMQPYLEKQNRMTDGIHPLSKMLGDGKFHEHSEIDSSVAERWREGYREDFLSEITWHMAQSLGYEKDSEIRTVPRETSEQPARGLEPIRRLPRRGRVTAD
jgi:hypothetical protein